MIQLDDGNVFDYTKPSINRLFASAAVVYGSRAIAVLVSGRSRGGVQGLRDIEAAGGVAIVQGPEDALEPLMPRNGLRSDHPHYCVKAADIGLLVQQLAHKVR